MGRKCNLPMTRLKDKSREVPDSTLRQDHTSSAFCHKKKSQTADFYDVRRVQRV